MNAFVQVFAKCHAANGRVNKVCIASTCREKQSRSRRCELRQRTPALTTWNFTTLLTDCFSFVNFLSKRQIA